MVTEPGRELEVWLDLWKPTEYHEYDDFNDEDEEYEHMHTYESPPRDEVNLEEEMVVVDEEATILQEERIIEGEEVLIHYDIFQQLPKKNQRKRKRGSQAWNTVQISEKEREKRIQNGFRYKPMRRRQTEEIEDVRLLKNKQRWKMYHYWVQEYLRVIKQELEGPAEAYNKACSDYSQMKQEIDCHVARGADIIGMTTTGAAKYHHILNNIHPKIVIIEEAAEVFESHVITSLPPSVQQLILIGDHKQLRPKPNHYELEKKYNLDVSLFQRLIENGIPHVTLTVQHRMRPDIASLIHPAIYPELQNGPRAIKHGQHKIAGVGHNLFFIHHENEEERQNPNESLSHKNIHEAAFMVALCRYLIKQGYKPTQITLLTMYRGQLLEMRSRMKRIEFEGVRVAAVDDFQAECPPCTAKCSNYCPHSKCPKNCYEPCDPCAEPCQWNCDHLKCTKKCGELCNRPRCDMPCLERLECGHQCIGLCGDKCPKLCRVCDNDMVTEIFFGTEDEPDARFVQLQDCKHVFEYTGLDQWMDREESEEIQFKKCPRCSTLMRTSLRYYNEVKKVHNHFEEIKKKQLQMSNIGQVLITKLRELKSKGGKCVEVTADVKRIESLLSPGTRPRYILPHCLNAIQNQMVILPTIITMYNELTQVKQKSWQLIDCNITVGTLNQELRCVQKFLMQKSLTDQQLSDIQCEIQRLNCVIRLFSIHSLLKERNCDVTPEDKESLEVSVSQVYCSGTKGTAKMSEYLAEVTNSLNTRFKKEYKLEGLTDAERIEIVNAIGLSKGRWFKCPNGHYYCIGECGGAMEVAKCSECDAKSEELTTLFLQITFLHQR
ncbi:NFX1-type zinc finger-containing protein 1 [Geodia barretti]|nr:NFX1-type zinc finger-containing protein 1 [Geodia barretti]